MQTPNRTSRLTKPQKPLPLAENDDWMYAGQRFTVDQPRLTAEAKAELFYLRDLTQYYEQLLRGYHAWERSFSEALNSGDGSYRP